MWFEEQHKTASYRSRNEKAVAINKNKTSYGKMGVFNCPNHGKEVLCYIRMMIQVVYHIQNGIVSAILYLPQNIAEKRYMES